MKPHDALPETSTILSEAFGNTVLENLPFIHESLQLNAQKYPNKIALISRHQSRDLYPEILPRTDAIEGGTCLRWSYQSLQKAARNLITSLEHHGIQKGMRVATFLNNGVEYVLMQWVCFHLGCPFAPLNPRSLPNHREVLHMLKTAEVGVIIAADARIAALLDDLISSSGLSISLKICVAEDEDSNGWVPFSSLLVPHVSHHKSHDIKASRHSPNDTVLIMFTSGTTSLPKACPHTYNSLAANLHGRVERSNVDNTGIYCGVTPNNHMNGCLAPLAYLCVGGTIVYPSPTFNAPAMLTALEAEKCTNTVLVPTILQALLDAMRERGGKLEWLKQVDLGGAMVLPKHLKQCIHELGAKKVGTSFGMTEGSPLRSTPVSDPSSLFQNGSVTVGTPLPGVGVRICAPGSMVPVPRGKYGELHQSGMQVIKSYIGRDGEEEFYEEGGRRWFRTGDQAVMWEDGMVGIVGRYKDMIIRGGENISPLGIERVLNGIEGVDAQVVGCTDEIAGEVPVAIFESKSPVPITVMRDAVLRSMGPSFVPEQFFTIAQLGLEEWPKTFSGKIQKTKLAALVKGFRDAQHSIEEQKEVSTGERNASLEATVLHIWSSLLSLPPDQIDKDSPPELFADSISILRFRDKLKKETGRTLTLEDMVSHKTIGAQIQFLANQNPQQELARPEIRDERKGPPTADDMIHTHGDPVRAEETQRRVQDVIEPFGLSWQDDVEDVMPAYDFAVVTFKPRRLVAWTFRYALVTTATSPQALRTALQAALSKHSILRSFFIRQTSQPGDESALYVTIRPTEKWFRLCIVEEAGRVGTVEELKRYAFGDNVRDHATLPGPLFRAMMVWVEDMGSWGLVFNVHHSVLDALSMRLFNEDLDQALRLPSQALHNHVPYKLYSDTYYSLRTSLSAHLAIDYHVQRLSSLGSHRAGLFPPQRAPEWFWGRNTGCQPNPSVSSNFSNPNREMLDPGTDELDNELKAKFDLPSINKLRSQIPGLASSVIAKAAIALLNTHYTSHTHAVFRSTEAGRGGLPFLPEELGSYVDINCTDIAGPCWQHIVELIEVRQDEKLGSFLERLQAEQTFLTKYSQAPVLEIMKRLGMKEDGTGTGDMLPDIFRRESFNWAPGIGTGGKGEFEGLRSVQSLPRNDMGIGFRVGVGGRKGDECRLLFNWDGANVRREEAGEMLRVLERVLRWVCEEGGVEREIGGVLEVLRGH